MANTLAASRLCAWPTKVAPDQCARRQSQTPLKSFHALPHRLEIVGEERRSVDQRLQGDERKLVQVAIAGMRRPTILLMGGRHKGEPYTSLADSIRKSVKSHCLWRGGADNRKDLAGVVPIERLGCDFDEVMRTARDNAAPGTPFSCRPRARASTCSRTMRSAARDSGSSRWRSKWRRLSLMSGIDGTWARKRDCCF